MKKILLMISTAIIVLLIVGILISRWPLHGWNGENREEQIKESPVPEFAGTWARMTKYNAEFISFSEDGHFAYYGSEGNGVNDYDLCDSYKYNPQLNILEINCAKGIGEDTPTKIEVVSFDEDTLILKFLDEEKTFMSKEVFEKMLKEKINK